MGIIFHKLACPAYKDNFIFPTSLSNEINIWSNQFSQPSSVSTVQSLSHVWRCDPIDCSTPGFPVHHQLLELAQTHFHHVHDAIQPSHPLLSPSPPGLNLSQHQGLSQWVSFLKSGGQSIGASASASVLPMNIQDWFPLGLTDLISLQPKGLSRAFSNNILQKHQFFSAQFCLWFNSHIHTWLLEKPLLWLDEPLTEK